MSKPVGYLATNPTYPLNANKLVWEPENWHITWEFKPLYLHPDPRVAELEAVLLECREALMRIEGASMSMYATRSDMTEHMRDIASAAIAKIDEVLK